MTSRPLASLTLAVLLATPLAAAVETGKADGSIVINRKPVKMKYAFAKKEKDFDKKDRWIVVLTDRAVSRAVLNDDSRFRKAIENGEIVAMTMRFDEKKALDQVEVKSKALQHKGLPFSVSQIKLTAPAFTADAVEAAAASTKEMSFFSDVAEFDLKFRAALGNEKFGDNPLAAKELAASAPKIADGQASGTLKVDGKTVKLTHAIARTKRNSFDEKKKDVVVLLTQVPVAPELFVDDMKLFSEAEAGKVQGLLVTIDSDEKPYHLYVLDSKANMQLSGSGIFNFDSTDFSEKHVSGKFFTTEEQDFMGKHKYSYDVTFAVPVQMIAVASEMTVDASSGGTKLPAGGGDPGKAYMAFDKAARSGNLSEMKKYASSSRPLPDMTPEEQKQMIEMMKLMRPANVKVTGGYVSGDHATLSVDAVDPDSKSKMHGTIEMARESGTWRLLGESWKQ
jgi:hypothetical protein